MPGAILDPGTFNFKHLSQVVLKKMISMYIYDLNQGSPGAGPSWTLGPSFEQNW